MANKVGDLLVAQNKLSAALASYRDGLTIAERLARLDPTNRQWQDDVLVSHRRLALHGDDPAPRWTLITTALRKLQAEDTLTDHHARWLAEAERQLAGLNTPKRARSRRRRRE